MGKINSLSLDLETYSDVDLNKCGVYKYAQSHAFEILLFGVSVNGGEVQVYDLAQGESVPMEIVKALTDNSVLKWAFNASFERVCLSVWLQRYYPQYFESYSIHEDTVGDYLAPSAWRCSMVWSAYMGLPLSLAGVRAVHGLPEQKRKKAKTSFAISVFYAGRHKATAAGQEICRNMMQISGRPSRHQGLLSE